MKRVYILQHRLFHYRVPLFSALRESLAEMDIELTLIHGQASPFDREKQDTGELSWATTVHNRYVRVFGRDLLWQQLPRGVWDADLVIAMQENKIISNYWLQFLWRSRTRLFAYWGHGRNMQSVAPNGLLETWKAIFVNKADWWFAYTSTTSDFLSAGGFPARKITCLNNAVDVTEFKRELQSVTIAEMRDARQSLTIQPGSKVGLYCGSLYVEKRLEDLILAACKIWSKMENFQLIVIGDGPQMAYLKEISSGLDWVKIVGAKRGREKAVLHRLADFVLCPGALGLQVLDSFAAGLPVVTLSTSMHGPEFAYLRDNQNSIVVDSGSIDELANRAASLLGNAQQLDEMQLTCRSHSNAYTIENMVGNFTDGIVRCLAQRK